MYYIDVLHVFLALIMLTNIKEMCCDVLAEHFAIAVMFTHYIIWDF